MPTKLPHFWDKYSLLSTDLSLFFFLALDKDQSFLSWEDRAMSIRTASLGTEDRFIGITSLFLDLELVYTS